MVTPGRDGIYRDSDDYTLALASTDARRENLHATDCDLLRSWHREDEAERRELADLLKTARATNRRLKRAAA